MSSIILTLNAGSSSIKFAVFNPSLKRLRHGEIDYRDGGAQLTAFDENDEAIATPNALTEASNGNAAGHESAIRFLLNWVDQQLPQHRLMAAAHRVVHGGEQFTQPVRITPEVLQALDGLCPLAPLHQAHNLGAIRILMQLHPDLPQIACFDTAFHAGQDWVASAYALPAWVREKGVKRYGFHGLSYEYIASVLPQYLSPAKSQKVVVAHLGNGASLCALKNYKSIATTMGFTALEGLVMGTRCGRLDPGVVLYLMNTLGLSAQAVEALLYKESGLLGVSGVSSDMRALEASDDPHAQQAVDLFVYRIVLELGSLIAVLGGLDALVFTAGIGEHSALIREKVCRHFAWLGLELNKEANQHSDRLISTLNSRVSIWIIPTNEEHMLAQHALLEV